MAVVRKFVTAFSLTILALFADAGASAAQSQCRKVADDVRFQIDPAAVVDLAKIGINRDEIFKAIQRTSVPETNGCWAGASGDFDNQILSVGVAQWNLGTGSLQGLLSTYRTRLRAAGLTDDIRKLAPVSGHALFSDGCLKRPVTADCEKTIKGFQSGDGRFRPDVGREIDSIFETDLMVQIQIDQFVRLLTSVRADLGRLFPDSTPTPRQIKWAIDTKVQQGTNGFPGDADVRRIRDKISSWQSAQRSAGLFGILRWYDGLCRTSDQDGVRYDCDLNMRLWQGKIGSLNDEQVELLYMSHLRSRVASTKSGLYQALAFQRRAKIVFDGGSVHGRID